MKRLLIVTVALIFSHGFENAFAQRLEIAGGATVHRLSKSETTTAGMTGRFTVDLTRWLAAEAEIAFFPGDDITVRSTLSDTDFGLVYERQRVDGFFGAKIGHRGSRYGIFGKVRPGFTRLNDQGVGCVGVDCARILAVSLLAAPRYQTEFALDVGGGVEFFPSRRTVVRFEFGDTMIRHRSFAPPCWQGTCTSHNFTTRVGAGMRF